MKEIRQSVGLIIKKPVFPHDDGLEFIEKILRKNQLIGKYFEDLSCFIRQEYVLAQSDTENQHDNSSHIGVVKDQNTDCIPLQCVFDKNNVR